MRKSTMTTIATGSELLSQIEACAPWAWANNHQNKGALERLVAELRAGMNLWHQAFLTDDPAAVRKRHSKELIVHELKGFMDLKPKCDAVWDCVNKMQRRNAS